MENSSQAVSVYDVCVVGTGPGGIVCCLELSRLRPDLKILLLEYGEASAEENSLDQAINVTNIKNHHPPAECTNKGFGGSSATWGGRCVTYDDIDFLQRPIVENQCTWDLNLFQEAKKFYPVAAGYMECGTPQFSFSACFPNDRSHITEKFVPGDVTDDCLERWSMPTRFGPRYRETVDKAENVTYQEPIEVQQVLQADGETMQVLGKDRKTGQKVSFSAKKVVLACGAQETTRILFHSPALFKSGGFPPSLGKYYQGHISGKIASVVFEGDPKKTDFGFGVDNGIYVRRRFQFSTDLLLKEDLLNIALWLDNPLYSDPTHRNGTMSFIYMMMKLPVIGKRLAPPAIAQSITKGDSYGVGPHIKNILLGLPNSLIQPAKIFVGRYLSKRKLPGVFLYSSTNRYALHFHGEQVPLETNSMTLSEDGKILNIEYRYCEADVDSVIRSHRILDQWLRSTKAGRLEYWYPDNELAERIHGMSRDGLHQVGTTRISDSAEDGVVDRNLRLWANDNVYICCGSAFPTSGQANPTFLLTAFAARLALHISENA